MKKQWLVIFAALLMSATGCINIDYVGQSLAPLPEGSLVTFYAEKQEYDRNQYEVLGRVTVDAPDGVDQLSVKEKLQDLAIKHGASAVKYVSIKRVNMGDVFITDNFDDNPNARLGGVSSRTVGGNPIYTNSFGQTGQLETAAEPRYEIIINCLLLADKQKFDAAMAELQVQKDKINLDFNDSCCN